MDETLLVFARKQAKLFENDNIAYTEALLRLRGCRKMMVWVYCALRNYKMAPAIEELDKVDKEHIWEIVKDLCKGEHREKQKMKEMAMALYALEYFLNEKDNNNGRI